MKLTRASAARTAALGTDRHVIGLDIGATAVRAAVLAFDGRGGGCPLVTVQALGAAPLPRGAVVAGEVADAGAVTAAIQALWQAHRFASRRVILGVSHPQAVVRPLQIPNLTAQQRAKALPFQARDVIALPLDEVVLDYAQLGEPDPLTGKVSGLLIATPRRPVLTAVNAVQKAGLTVVRVDLSSFGALRSVAGGGLGAQAVVDTGAHLTSIVIHHEGIPRLVRTIARGGDELTDRLVDELDLSAADAERRKAENGLTGPDVDVAGLLRAGIRPLLAEIRSSANYFRSTNDGVRLEGIVLTGGGSRLTGLADAVSSQLGVPATVGSAMSHLANPPGPGPTMPPGRTPDDPAAPDPARTGPAAAPGTDHPAASAVSIGLALGAAA